MSRAYRNIARVVRPHGKDGEVVVQPVRGLPFLLSAGLEVALTPPALERDRFCRVEAVRDDGKAYYARFSGVHDIASAESIASCWVLAAASDLDIDEGAYAFDDVIGRPVVDARYGALGELVEILETPANDVWVVDNGPFGEVLIPVIESCIDAVPEEGPLPVHIIDGIIDASASADGAA